jgi:hypothetical protein
MKKLLVAMVVLALGCGGDSTTEPTTASVAGTWELSTVNGAPLPFIVIQSGTSKLEWTADVITATSTGSFTQISTFRTTDNGQVTTNTVPDAGSYTLNGTAVTFTFNSDGSTGTGSINGNTLTVTQPGTALVYIKQ